jgi:ferredoxin
MTVLNLLETRGSFVDNFRTAWGTCEIENVNLNSAALSGGCIMCRGCTFHCMIEVITYCRGKENNKLPALLANY